MKYAWIENDHVRDVAPGDPFQFYAPEVAQFYSTLIPDDIQQGATWDGERWINQIIRPTSSQIIASIKAPRRIGQAELREAMTLSERVRWDNDLSPTIKTVKIELSVARFVDQVKPILQLLVDAGDISAQTVAALDLDAPQESALNGA